MIITMVCRHAQAPRPAALYMQAPVGCTSSMPSHSHAQTEILQGLHLAPPISEFQEFYEILQGLHLAFPISEFSEILQALHLASPISEFSDFFGTLQALTASSSPSRSRSPSGSIPAGQRGRLASSEEVLDGRDGSVTLDNVKSLMHAGSWLQILRAKLVGPGYTRQSGQVWIPYLQYQV